MLMLAASATKRPKAPAPAAEPGKAQKAGPGNVLFHGPFVPMTSGSWRSRSMNAACVKRFGKLDE